MCGIIGIFHREQPIQESDQELLERVLEKKIESGIFGADMKIALINEGPVTIIIDTKNRE